MSQQAVVNAKGSVMRVVVGWTVLICGCIALLCVLPRPTAQLLLAPAVLIAAARVRLFSLRIPLAVVVAASVGIASGAAFRFSHVALSNGAFLVSALRSDKDLQQESKIYRDKMRRALGAGGDLLVGLYNGKIVDAAQARVVLDRSPQLGGIVWGSMRWMNVSLQSYPALAFSTFEETSAAHDYLQRHSVPDLLIVRSVPSVGISHADQRASVAFLSGAARLWRDVPHVLVPRRDRAEFDSVAIGLGRMRARWTSRAHLGFPLWLAGTRHLVRAIEGAELDVGELRCAVRRLKQAAKMCRGQGSPHLETAVRSNYALALLMYADTSPKRERFKKVAFRQMAAAARFRKKRVEGGLAASHNRMALEREYSSVKAYAKRKRV
jgi:hypothetical protein